MRIGTIIVLAVALTACKTHLDESVKAEASSEDTSTTHTDVDSTVSQDSSTASNTSKTEKNTQDPTVTDTEVEIKVEATATRPAKTVVIKKHQVKGQKTDVKVEINSSDVSTQTQGKVDEDTKSAATHSEQTKVDAKTIKDSEAKIPFGISCLGGGSIIFILLILAAVFMPGVLTLVLKKVVTFLKTFWEKFKEE